VDASQIVAYYIFYRSFGIPARAIRIHNITRTRMSKLRATFWDAPYLGLLNPRI